MTTTPEQPAEPLPPTETAPRREINEPERKIQINNLAIGLLRQLNPQVSPQDVETNFLQTANDIYRDTSLVDLRKRFEVPAAKLNGYQDSLNIAKFYWDAREDQNARIVPTKVVIQSEGASLPKLTDDPNEKVLVYVNDKDSASNATHYEFGDKRSRKVLLDVPQTRPDVYLRWISTAKKLKATTSGRARIPSVDPEKKTGDFTLDGCDNLLIASHYGSTDALDSVKLSCQGSCAILPDAQMEGGVDHFKSAPITKIELQVPNGNIVQYEGTRIGIQDITCLTYIQNGGQIVRPAPDNSLLTVYAGVDFNGGERPDDPELQIRDLSKIDLAPSAAEATRLAAGLGLEADTTVSVAEGSSKVVENGKEAENPKTLEQVQTEFDDAYPDNREIRLDTGEVTRGFNFPFVTKRDEDKYRDFARHALAAGWKIVREPLMGKIVSVTIQKKSNS